MTEHELIAKQQLQIEEMRKTLKECANAFRTIRSVIYCIGGPLNDNKRGYNHEQMKDFLRIANECMALEDYTDSDIALMAKLVPDADERKLRHLGDEIHNASCTVIHLNEEIGEHLGQLASELWNWEKTHPPAAQPQVPESELLETLDERDRWEDLATELAAAVGEHFGVDVGEHSSANCPVAEAMKILNGEYVTKFTQPQVPEGIVEKYNELLYHVARKIPNESRHETALRYIKNAEYVESYFAAAKEEGK